MFKKNRINSVELTGNLAKDPVVIKKEGKKTVTFVTIATTGSAKAKTRFNEVKFFGEKKLDFKKGVRVNIHGNLVTEKVGEEYKMAVVGFSIKDISDKKEIVRLSSRIKDELKLIKSDLTEKGYSLEEIDNVLADPSFFDDKELSGLDEQQTPQKSKNLQMKK